MTQMENLANKASRTVHKVQGAIKKGVKIEKAVARKVKGAERKVVHNLKHQGAQKVKTAVKHAVKHAAASARRAAPASRRHHKRELEADEELLSRGDFVDAEDELFEREYDDDFLVERDFFDDLD